MNQVIRARGKTLNQIARSITQTLPSFLFTIDEIADDNLARTSTQWRRLRNKMPANTERVCDYMR